MSLARVWRRQLWGASTTALIVPCAVLAAVVALALGGGFGSVGVLGQLFAGPSLPGVGPAGGAPAGPRGDARGLAMASLPVVPAVARVVASRGAIVHRAAVERPVSTASRGAGSAGGAIGGTGTVRPVTEGAGGPGSSGTPAGSSGPPAGSPGSGSSAPSPQPGPPPPKPTPVDTAVKIVTSVTQQLPAPAGPVATQTVQAAGSAVDNLLPQTGQP